MRVTDAFRQTTGFAPDGCWMAPGRVNLIGEHTDYNDGHVLPAAIARGIVVAAARRRDNALVVSSLREPGGPLVLPPEMVRPGGIDGWASYAAGAIWALRDAGHAVGGVELVVDGDLPVGAGLSSSAALICAVLLACTDLYENAVPRHELARLAQRAERDYVGVSVGIMDPSASLLARAGCALLLDARTLESEHIPVDLTAAGLDLLVIDTRSPHRLVDGAYADRRRACEQAAEALGVPALRDVAPEHLDSVLRRLADPVLRRRARHVVTEEQRVLEAVDALRDGDVRGLGPLLTASHASLRDDFEVSCPELDAAVDAALDGGALGARMIGGGFGGSAIALAPAGEAGQVVDAVTTTFERRAFAAPAVFAASPADGARRLA